MELWFSSASGGVNRNFGFLLVVLAIYVALSYKVSAGLDFCHWFVHNDREEQEDC